MHNGQPVQGVGPIVGIMDAVKVPANLVPGKYVLGWRYDCEATAQVWSNCADIARRRARASTDLATSSTETTEP